MVVIFFIWIYIVPIIRNRKYNQITHTGDYIKKIIDKDYGIARITKTEIYRENTRFTVTTFDGKDDNIINVKTSDIIDKTSALGISPNDCQMFITRETLTRLVDDVTINNYNKRIKELEREKETLEFENAKLHSIISLDVDDVVDTAGKLVRGLTPGYAENMQRR